MRKHIQLNIPEPCHESWDQMTPVDKGRFCGSCQKQVVDFTNMSDEQLALFLKKTSNGSVCGRFMQDQLDRSIGIPKKRIPWVKYFFQFALPAFLISSKAVAQGKERTLKGDTVMVCKPEIEEIGKIKAIEIEKRITGKVVDDNGEGIPYASVFIKGTTIGVATDSLGNFALKYYGNQDSIVLESSSVGFQIAESIVSLNKSDEHIAITLPYNNTLGEVVVVATDSQVMGGFVGGVVVKKVSIIDSICNKIFPAKQSLKLYPNPLKRNTSLTIEMNKHEKGTYLFQLTALNGQVVLSKEKWMDKNDRFAKIDIPLVAAGTYVVNMINKQSGKSNTGKIIVE